MLYLGTCRCQAEWPGAAARPGWGWNGGAGGLIATRVVVAPAFEPLTLEEVKRAHRIDEDLGDDFYIRGLISAAREYCERYLGASLVAQTREADYASYDAIVPLPFGPVQEIVSVTGDSPVVVRYIAGYETRMPVPESIKTAMQLLIGDWYEQREQTVIGKTVANLGIGVHQLLDFHRQRLGVA